VVPCQARVAHFPFDFFQRRLQFADLFLDLGDLPRPSLLLSLLRFLLFPLSEPVLLLLLPGVTPPFRHAGHTAS